MPRRLSPLPGPRLQQSSRRMEPDGALLQFQQRAQYPWPQTLHGAHCKRTFVASARSNSPSTPRSRRAEPILELIPVSVRPLPPHPVFYVIDAGSCPASTGVHRKFLSTLTHKNISVFQKRKSVVSSGHPASVAEGRIAIVTTREAGMRWTRTRLKTSGGVCGRSSRVVLARPRRRQVGDDA